MFEDSYFIYVKRSKVDITSLVGEYLAYIGGQNHVLYVLCMVFLYQLHVPVAENSVTDVIQLIACLVFAKDVQIN